MNKKLLCFLLIIFIGSTYAIFYYWNIDESNRWSTFFSFTSTFGIFATIIIYRKQKKDNENTKEKETQDEIRIIKKSVNYALNENIVISSAKIDELIRIKNELKKNADFDFNIPKNAQHLELYNLHNIFYRSMKYSDEFSGIIDNTINIINVTNSRIYFFCSTYQNQLTLCNYIIEEYKEAKRRLESSKYELDQCVII